MTSTRFPVLDAQDMTDLQREVAAEISSGPRGGVKGPFLALLHNPRLARCVQRVGEHLRFDTQLPPDVIELAILVVARDWDCQYEWYAHERLARKNTSLSPDIMQAVAQGRHPEGMTPDQATAYRFCIETLRDGEPGEAAYRDAAQRYGREGVLDLVALCGYYTLLAMVLNTSRIPLPEGEPRPLAPRRRAGAQP